MRLLVLGASGMLGTSMMAEARRRQIDTAGAARRPSATTRPFDLRDDESLRRLLEEVQPSVVVNCAALTSVGECEVDRGAAYEVNARAVAVMATLTRELGVRLVQISTDHYFAGDGARPHDEDHPVTLVNEYARSKYAGESFALTSPGCLVIRTSIVGFRSPEAPATFVHSAIAGLSSNEPITVFDDSWVSTIEVGLFSRALLDLLRSDASGVVNLASSEVFTKADLIEAVATNLDLPTANMRTGSVESLDPARADSLGLDVSRAEGLLGSPLPGLAETAQAIAESYRIRDGCPSAA